MKSLGQLIRDITTKKDVKHYSSNDISCSTADLKEFIEHWITNEGWTFTDFASFLELVGLKVPVKLSEFDEEKECFHCVDAVGKECTIKLEFGDFFDFCSEIWLTINSETLMYTINTRYPRKKNIIPQITLDSRILKKDGNELNSHYSEYFCHRSLKYTDGHTLFVNFDEPDKYEVEHKTRDDVRVAHNFQAIEDYLISITTPKNVLDIYFKMIELYQLTPTDIEKIETIEICYTEEDRVRSCIKICSGKVVQLATYENGETFHVYNSGNWTYISDSGIKIHFDAKTNHHSFSIDGNENSIVNATPAKTLKRVSEKICDMMTKLNTEVSK